MSRIFKEKDEGTIKSDKKRKKDREDEGWEKQEIEEDDVDVELLSEDSEFMGE